MSTQSSRAALAGGDTAAATPPSGAFVRKSSGLVREFSVTDVVAINLAGLNPGILAALSITALAGLWPGASMVLVVIIGALVAVATVITYGMLSATMPRSGGDYVFVGRSLTPWVGFLANWMITWSLFVLLGLFSVGTITFALAPALAGFGFVADSSFFTNFANDLTATKGNLALAAIVLMLITVAIALSGDRVIKYAFRTLVAIGLGGMVIAVLMLLLTGPETFETRLDAALTANGGTTIDGMRAAADEAGFGNVDFSVSASLSALPYAFYAFVGLTYTSYLGGEIQKPQRSQPLGMFLSLAIGVTLYVVLFIGVYHTIGWDNIHSWAFLSGADPDALAGFYGGAPFGSFLFAALTDSPVLAFVMVLTFFAWFLLILLFAVVMPVRNLFAWSLDGVFPQWIAKVGARGTPWVATLIVSVIALGVTFVAVYSDFLSLVVNYTLFYSTTFLIAGIAAMAFPYRRPDLFARAPRSVQRRIAGVPLLSIAGAVQTIAFAVIIWKALDTPAFGGPTGRNALLFIGGLLVAAPVVFFISRALRKRAGYDVDAVWTTLPPE